MVSTAMIGTKIFCFPSQIDMAFAMALTALLYTLKFDLFIYLFIFIIFIIFIFYVTLLSSFQLVGDSEVSVST